MFSKRFITAAIFIAIMVFSTVGGGLWLASVIAIIVYIAVKELVSMLKSNGINPSLRTIMLTDLALLVSAGMGMFHMIPAIIAFATIATFIVMLSRRPGGSIADIATTMMGFLYTGFLPIHFIFLRDIDRNLLLNDLPLLQQYGFHYVLITFLAIWGSDIGAYYCGKSFGKKKLASVISPNKTVEGAIGGSIIGILLSILVGRILEVAFIHNLILSILMVAAAQLGDLCESLIKRNCQVKDSGTVLPGHGGMMDRSDSYVFCAPIAYYYVAHCVL